MQHRPILDDMPSQFFWLLPLGMAIIFCQGTCISTVVLETLALAESTPQDVLFLPKLLKYSDAETVAGAALATFTLGLGLCGPLAGKLSDLVDIRCIGGGTVVLMIAGSLLASYNATFLVGLLVLTIGLGASQATFQTFFSLQFDDNSTNEKAVTYYYGFQNLAFLVATLLAGIQPFWCGYAESAALLALGCLSLSAAPVKFRYTRQVGPVSLDAPVHGHKDRELAYGFLCVFTCMFFVVFFQFLGGPFVLFCRDMLGPLGAYHVPAPMFLSLNGFIDIVIAAIMVKVYSSIRPVKFYTKMFMSFAWLALASALVAYSSIRYPAGHIRPSLAALAIVLCSVGELHYNPVMLSAISTTMPEAKVGLYTGIHFMLSGVGGAMAGMGVPLYKTLGPAVYFTRLTALSVVAMAGLGLAQPYLSKVFASVDEEWDEGERKALTAQSTKVL